MPESQSFVELLEAMKRGASALQDGGVPFLLGGSLASWARGGPPTDHDVDFFVRRHDAEAATEALRAAGMPTERPPEGWLVKAYDGRTLIDVIFEPSGLAVDDAMFARADVLDVYGSRMCVASVEDVLATKLSALNEQRLDYSSVLAIARALREQVDWDDVRRRTERSPYARAFFALLEELQITRPAAADEPLAAEASGLTSWRAAYGAVRSSTR